MEVIWIGFLLTAYFTPVGVAFWRTMPNTGAIFIVNLLLGWTVVGWIIALVMACVQKQAQPPPSIHRPGDVVNGWVLTIDGHWVPAVRR